MVRNHKRKEKIEKDFGRGKIQKPLRRMIDGEVVPESGVSMGLMSEL